MRNTVNKRITSNQVLPFGPRNPGLVLPKDRPIRFIDLFCGIGGFHTAARSLGLTGVFACDIDEECRKAYHHNYGLMPHGNISDVDLDDIPEHDLLCAGFPCQPSSIIGDMAGFADSRGALFLN
jgi:DNA (cytosine-5)-methyltransferase 1